MKNIVITARNNFIEINDANEKYFLETEYKQNEFFKSFKNFAIKKIYYNHKDCCIIIMKNGIQLLINNYAKLKKKNCFTDFNKKINNYHLNKILNRISGKNLIIAGSLALTIISFHSFAAENNQSNSLDSIHNDISIENSIDEEIEILDIDFNELQIKEKVSSEKTIEIPTVDEKTVYEEIIETTVIEEKKEDNIIDFSDLKDFNIYEEYINFAANLYGVDYDTALNVVKENFESFTSPIDNNIGMYTNELTRMKDLKARGAIEGDLNVIGIFITIKDYAIDNLDLNNQNPIISNKTIEEKEKDIIDIAKYIYGINNQELLNCLLATHRLETGHGTSDAVIYKNNFGGNMNPKSNPDAPVLNIYKTAEIGEESMVRNFLNCYGKCFYNKECNQYASIPVFMSKMYCTHTPDDWAREIIELENENIEEDINKYLNSNEKTM